MNRRWTWAVAAVVLAAAVLVVWRARPRDPGPVAPPVTAHELRQIGRAEVGSLTLLGGGSTSQAHRLWSYYTHRDAYQDVKPRLLGISRVRLSGTSSDGVYWLVFSDRVYTPSFGPDARAGGYGREAVLVPDNGRSVSGNTTTF
jgi:hypothetical protein